MGRAGEGSAHPHPFSRGPRLRAGPGGRALIQARPRLEVLATEHHLGPPVVAALETLLALLAGDPHAPTTVQDPGQAVDVHVADSLSGLTVPAVADAAAGADLGSGAGLPGLVLAATRPATHWTLVEAGSRKAAWIERAAREMGLTNVEVRATRAEDLPAARFDVVTARALAALPVVVEYAAPVLIPGGVLVAWKGAVTPEEEADGDAASAALGLDRTDVLHVKPFPAARSHRLYLYSKVRDTPPGYPRRAGLAGKRPLRADYPQGSASS